MLVSSFLTVLVVMQFLSLEVFFFFFDAAQLRGHTLESKWEVFNEAKKCGFTDFIIASYNHMTRVDDIFSKQLVEKGEDPKGLWAFSEITNSME